MLILKLLLCSLMFLTALGVEEKCPAKCICKKNALNESSLKMTCGEKEKIYHLDELELLNLASELIQLNLSGNGLNSFQPKVELIILQKLDLSRNQLTELKAHQFNEVPNLKRLDVSQNNIKHIDLLAFDKLRHLEKLKLNQNQISAIVLGTFGPLENIKQLDISNNPLVCDCSLLWLHDWIQRQSVKLLSNPKCTSPSGFKGKPLRKLRIGDDIHCKSPAGSSGLPFIELTPNENQVVFEGDSLTMQCDAPSISDSLENPLQSGIQWTWSDFDPEAYFTDIRIENELLGSAGRISSTLVVPKLAENHTGTWNCQFMSLHGNHSKGITVVVISEETKYCPMTVTKNNKGTYNWPRAIVNFTVTVPCECLNLNYDVSHQKASYTCTNSGEWSRLNTTMCSYISDTTKILEQFSMVDSSIEESAKHFRNYTSNRSIFKDVVDLHFAVSTVENYVRYAPKEHAGTVASILMDSVNSLMDLSRGYLRHADLEYGTSRRLVGATERIAVFLNPSNFHKNNLAIEVFPVEKETFRGLTCTLYTNPSNKMDSLFSCSPSHQQDTATYQGRIADASVTIPESLFRQLTERQNVTTKDFDVLVSIHSSGKLFSIDQERYGKEDVTSAVVGVQLVDCVVKNLTDPVYVMLRTPSTQIYEVTPFLPVRWDPTLNNGTGKWSPDGCAFSHEINAHLVFSCDTFGYYGLMQDVTLIEIESVGAKFKLSHPAIYVGIFVLFATFVIVILTYLLCYVTIQIPKKTKHSLVNTWIAIALLSFFYIFGIYQTENTRVCQIVGMILHYFTLCSLLWMCVGVNCMYKRLSKNDAMLQDDDLPLDYPIQKPILGLYLVGWGVGLIVCGLSAAINMNEYATPTHCFLKSGPALSALYIPCAILTAFLAIFFLLIRCAIYNLDANGHLSEGTQATEHVDLDLLEPNFNIENRSVRSVSTKTCSSEIEDPEHAPSAQLKAYVIFLFIYVMTWLSCAFATQSPFRVVAFEEDLFSVSFAVLSTTLSAFTLFFYCIARNDVRTKWVILLRWLRRKKLFELRSRNVSDASPCITQIQIQAAPVVEAPIVSRSTSRASSRSKSNSRNSNLLKGAAELNGSFSDHRGAKINNVNLVVLHRAQYRTSAIPNIIENPTNADLFYNPHQSTVARKFFKRQKRNMKKNNLTKPPRDLNSDTASVFSEPNLKINNRSDQNIFGTNSKVNNANIHVERARRPQQKNPNIFSDSAEEFDPVPVENIVMHAERLKKMKKKQNTMEMQRSNSSETVSENAPEKTLLPNQDSFTTTETSGAVPSVRRDNSPLSVLTETYCQIADINPSEDYYQKTGTISTLRPANCDFDSSSVGGESTARIYVNPHDARLGKGDGQSRASSVSVSDLDELYQQIRRGPLGKRQRNLYVSSHASPCLSDSEINSFIGDGRHVRNDLRSFEEFDRMSDDVETRV